MQRHCMGLFRALENKISGVCYNDPMDAAQITLYTRDGYIGTTRAAAILGISRWSVRNRIISGDLIGWRPTSASRNYRLWRRQVMEEAARQQANAIRRAHIMTSQMVLDI